LAVLAIGSLTVVSVIVEGPRAIAELAIFIIPVIVIGLLHPGLRSFRLTRNRIDGRVLAVAAVAAVPLLVFAALQTNLQLTLTDDHAGFDHYAFMAAGAATIALGALVASLRPAGWRFLVYGVATLVTLVGVASALYPDPVQGTNFGIVGGGLAVLWAISFVLVTEFGSREKSQSEAGPSNESATTLGN